MKNKKWKIAVFTLIILIAVAVGFFIREWSEPILWAGWFACVTAAGGIVTGGNYLEKKEYIKAEIEKDLEK